jgi:hypothetical protein
MLTYLVENYKQSPTVESYVDKMVNNFLNFMSLVDHEGRNHQKRLTVDCSNGVGSLTL